MIELDVKVLVVDPMVTQARSVADQLCGLGFRQVDQAHDGTDATRRIGEGDYGLILSEWDLSSQSGLDLLKAVRSDPRTKGLPFMLMTDQVDVDCVIAARQAGVSGYLVKPFTEGLLKQKLTGIFFGNRPALTA